MKKLSKMLALVLAGLMLLATVPALAEAPEGYPEIQIDPATGAPYDLGGMEIWIYDWWSPSDGSRQEADSTAIQDTYDYRDWCMETYNYTIKQAAISDWAGNPEALLNFCNEETPSANAVFIMRPDSVGNAMKNGLLYDLASLDAFDFEDEKWNQASLDFLRAGDSIYAMSTGKSEVRQVVFFNKRLLEDAGIDPDSLYTLVEEDAWTWDAFEDMLAQCQRDTDNDGVVDIYGMAAFQSDLYLAAVFSNGGSFFDVDADGNFIITATEPEAVDALNYAVDLIVKYQMPQGDAEWNYMYPAFKNGMAAFHVGQTYEVNPGSDLDGMEDEFGIVPFPKGTSDKAEFCHVQSENLWVMPGQYDAETANKIAFAVNLWTNETPGYETSEDDEAWKTTLYNRFCDDESIDITYALLRENPKVNKTALLGSDNDVLGRDFFWTLNGGGVTVAEQMEVKLPTWQALIDDANGAN